MAKSHAVVMPHERTELAAQLVRRVTTCSDSGVVVSIVAFQAVDPSSILGCRTLLVSVGASARLFAAQHGV